MPDARQIAGAALTGGLSAASAYALSKLLQARARTRMRLLPSARLDQIEGLYRAGLPRVPRYTVPGTNDLLYLAPDDAQSLSHRLRSRGLATEEDLPPRLLRRSGMLVGSDLAGVGQLAHELGHAADYRDPNTPWYAAQRYSPRGRLGLTLADLVAPIPGTLVGAATGNPMLGAGAAMLGAALARAPTVASEYRATRRAQRALDRLPLSVREREQQDGALRASLDTYVWPALVAAGVAGAGAGLVGRRT